MLGRNRLVIAAVCSVLVCACGDDDESAEPATAPATTTSAGASMEPSAEQRTAISGTIEEFNAAETPDAICAVITRGLEEAFATRGARPDLPPEQAMAPASPDCPSAVKKGQRSGHVDLVAQEVEVGKMAVERDRAAAYVTAVRGGKREPYFLLELDGEWKVVNFGVPPPDFQSLAVALG